MQSVSRKILVVTEIPKGVDVGGRELNLTLHCHHQYDFVFKWAAVYSLTVGGQSLNWTESINHNLREDTQSRLN